MAHRIHGPDLHAAQIPVLEDARKVKVHTYKCGDKRIITHVLKSDYVHVFETVLSTSKKHNGRTKWMPVQTVKTTTAWTGNTIPMKHVRKVNQMWYLDGQRAIAAVGDAENTGNKVPNACTQIDDDWRKALV